MKRKTLLVVLASAVFAVIPVVAGWGHDSSDKRVDRDVNRHSERMIERGRQTFRFDTFGSEAFWGDTLRLHEAIAGARNGGVGPGVSPKTALTAGLKVDADSLPDSLKRQIKAGRV